MRLQRLEKYACSSAPSRLSTSSYGYSLLLEQCWFPSKPSPVVQNMLDGFAGCIKVRTREFHNFTGSNFSTKAPEIAEIPASCTVSSVLHQFWASLTLWIIPIILSANSIGSSSNAGGGSAG